MKEINRERFEAWLFSQPKEREFDYTDSDGCAICAFIRETTSEKNPRVLPTRIENPPMEMPTWLDNAKERPADIFLGFEAKGVVRVRPLTIANMQARYLELFPDALKLPEVKTETVKV